MKGERSLRGISSQGEEPAPKSQTPLKPKGPSSESHKGDTGKEEGGLGLVPSVQFRVFFISIRTLIYPLPLLYFKMSI